MRSRPGGSDAGEAGDYHQLSHLRQPAGGRRGWSHRSPGQRGLRRRNRRRPPEPSPAGPPGRNLPPERLFQCCGSRKNIRFNGATS